MTYKNNSIVITGNINYVCEYLKKCSEDFVYIKDLIEFLNLSNSELS